ncbi:MAG: trypsin-like serine protease [Myxococcales bacterium]|nr:trypsin-like serine protease [Myxococcales bacterium]
MQHGKVVVALAFALQLAVACGGPDEPAGRGEAFRDKSVDTHAAALVNGAPHSGHPAVGELFTQNTVCTATLVGARTVVTAAHCVNNTAMYFEVDGQRYDVAVKHPHPGYISGASTITDDVAVVILAKAPSVMPMSLWSGAPLPGAQVTLVGFGRTSADVADGGTKRIGFRTISKLEPSELVYEGSIGGLPNLCFGDSGGPTFANVFGQDMQTGIHSYVSSQPWQAKCGTRGHDMRVDRYLPWIRSKAGADLFVDGIGPDLVAPEVKILTPAPGPLSASSAVVLRAQATDNVGVDRVEVFVDAALHTTLNNAGPNYQLELSKLAVGQPLTIKVVAYDAANNQAESSISITVEPPTPPPAPPEKTPPPEEAPPPPTAGDPSKPGAKPSPPSSGGEQPPAAPGGVNAAPEQPETNSESGVYKIYGGCSAAGPGADARPLAVPLALLLLLARRRRRHRRRV